MTDNKITISREFAHELCPDLKLVHRRDLGKTACINLMKDGEMCSMGTHFVCELVLYKMRSRAKEQREKAEAISASRINLFDSCARKYHLLREQYLDPPGGRPTFLIEGSAFSNARARLDTGLPVAWESLGDELSPLPRAKLRAAVRFYEAHPPYEPGSVTCEEMVHYEFNGAWFIGYADAADVTGESVREWKFAKGDYGTLQLARQAAVYLQGMPHVDTFVAHRFKKPSNRPRKTESMRDFEERVFDSLMEKGPDAIYRKTTITREDIDVEGVLKEMIKTFETVLPAARNAGYPPNYGSCGLCDFQTECGETVGVPIAALVRRLKQEQA